MYFSDHFVHPDYPRLHLQKPSASGYWWARTYHQGKQRGKTTRTADRYVAAQRAGEWYLREISGENEQVTAEVKQLFKNAKQRARRDGIPFKLLPSDLTIPETCPVLGIPLFRALNKPCDNSPTIDRIDNGLGYVRGNVVVVSYRANRIKADATLLELVKLASFYQGLSLNPAIAA